MIKNQLYPYVEKYINEYLWGFSKEQLDVGVMKGVILLEKLNIRPDKANEKLDSKDIPVWLKLGKLSKIQVTCSLMNFIGEKPLDVLIEDIDVLLSPSYKWILRNENSFIEENEMYMKDAYDAMDNNSQDIFSKKVHIYDGSIFKKRSKVLEFLNDKGKVTELIHKLYTRTVKFFYKKAFYINLKINKIHVRFEDDTFNYHGDLVAGLNIENVELSLSADGRLKKNSFKLNNLNLYYIRDGQCIVSSSVFLSKLDKEGNINENYYDFIKKIHPNPFSDKNPNKKQNEKNCFEILKNFNMMGKINFNNVDSNYDLFSKKVSKAFKLNIQIATSDINLNIFPDLTSKISSFQEFVKSFYINEPIQDFKPMRKPYYSPQLNNTNLGPNFKAKRKLVIRDWFYYFIWYSRFKQAIYGKPFKNKLQEEFSKYFNICCTGLNENDNNQLNDSINLKKAKEAQEKPPEEEKAEDDPTAVDPNPENINLIISTEFLVKGINLELRDNSESTSNANDKHGLNIKTSEISIRSSLNGKDKFDISGELKTITLNPSLSGIGQKLVITQAVEDNLVNEYNVMNQVNRHKQSNEYKQQNPNCETIQTESQNPKLIISQNPRNKDTIKDNGSVNNTKRTTELHLDTKSQKKLSVLNEILSYRKDVDDVSHYNREFNMASKNILQIFEEEKEFPLEQAGNRDISHIINNYNRKNTNKNQLIKSKFYNS